MVKLFMGIDHPYKQAYVCVMPWHYYTHYMLVIFGIDEVFLMKKKPTTTTATAVAVTTKRTIATHRSLIGQVSGYYM